MGNDSCKWVNLGCRSTFMCRKVGTLSTSVTLCPPVHGVDRGETILYRHPAGQSSEVDIGGVL